MVLFEGLVRRHGGVPEPDRPPPHPPSAPNRAPAPTVPAAALPASCSLHPQLSPTNSHTCSPPKGPAPTRRPPAPGPSGLPNGPGVGPGWLLLYTFVHFAAAISGDSCTGRSSWQLLPAPAPPATLNGQSKAYVQAARRHNFDLADLLRSWQDSWPNRLFLQRLTNLSLDNSL